MDISSKSVYPASALSNFATHPFWLDGIPISSMEGFLQSLKFSDLGVQKVICRMVGYKATLAGREKNWYRTQTLYWQGKEYKRDSLEYQDLLDRAYAALFQNECFRKALLSTGDEVLTHSIGKTSQRVTVLTQSEFCDRLMRLRAILR
jgi:predicted NAD-dependent protein-ADP-ribosyltransferase YbiA (DUF1768 family)